MKLFNTFLLLLKLCGVWFVAWALGCLAAAIQCYVTAKDFIFQGVNHGNNASSCAIETAAYSFVIIMPFFPILYLPVMFGLRWILGGTKRTIVFSFASAALYLIPMGYIYHSDGVGDWLWELVNPQGEFNVVVFLTGLFFGLGFAWVSHHHDAERALGADSPVSSLYS